MNARSRRSANCSTWFNGLRERCDHCQNQSAWHVSDAIRSRRVSSPAQLQRSAGGNASAEDRLGSWGWLDPAEPLLPCRLRLHGRLSPPPLTPRGPERRCHPGGHNEGEGFEHATGSGWWKMKRRAQARNGLAPWQRYILGPSGASGVRRCYGFLGERPTSEEGHG